MESKTSLGIFLKAPRAGRVKTRLAPLLGEHGAAALYTSFVADTVTLALNAPARHLLLWSDSDPATAWLGGEAGRALREAAGSRVTELRQSAGDLGARLTAAWRDARAAGRDRLLMLGSDSPDLPPAHLEEALSALDSGDDVVLGPATDGGVWCIGLARQTAGFFDGLPWSSRQTGRALRNRALERGLKLRTVAPWSDCDEPDDLAALRERLRAAEGRAKMTRAWLDENDDPGPA